MNEKLPSSFLNAEQTIHSEQSTKKTLEKVKFGSLGISLEKAENPGNARAVDEYKDDFKIPTIEWMEGEIAMAWRTNEPILIEGGTGIGKTRTVERMCAQLGYELYKLPCSSSTTEREMMGRYISNPNRKSETEPEVIFSLGVISEALKEEEGKIKVIYLDEINSMDSAVTSRLHDIIDELKKEKVKGRVKLVEDAGEVLEFDPKKVKVVATMNTANSLNTHAQKLSEALLRRFEYKRTVDELPDEEFLGMAIHRFQMSESLKDLPGITGKGELISSYTECHKALQGLKRNGKIGVGSAQDFKFEDIDYLKRVIKKVSLLWEDEIFTDLPLAFREAVKMVYTGMVTDPTEKKMMEEQISKIDFKPEDDKKRKGLSNKKEKKEKTKKTVEPESKEAGGEEEKIKKAAEEMLKKAKGDISSMKKALREKKKEISGEEDTDTIIAEHKTETIELNFEEKFESMEELYKKSGIELLADFRELMQDIWERNADAIREAIEESGYDDVLFIPSDLNIEDLDTKMTAGYKEKTFFGVGKEDIKDSNIEPRIVLVHNVRELTDRADLSATLGMKAEDFIKSGESLSLSEYLILQRKYFNSTGNHMDADKITWLPGSRCGDSVVRADWDSGFGQLSVHAVSPGRSHSAIGCRSSRCFK